MVINPKVGDIEPSGRERRMRATASAAPEPLGSDVLAVENEGCVFEGAWQTTGGELQVRIAGRGCDRGGGEDAALTARAIGLETIRSKMARSRRPR